jgi:hypothetical protein
VPSSRLKRCVTLASARRGNARLVSDLPLKPGLDRHDWEMEYEQLVPLLEESLEEALPELASLVERIMKARSVASEDAAVSDDAQELASLPAKQLADRARAGPRGARSDDRSLLNGCSTH